MPTREELQFRHWQEKSKLMRVMRKEIKPTRKEERVRERDWAHATGRLSDDDLDEMFDVEGPQEERVMPKGERERRRSNLQTARTRQLYDDDGQEAEEAAAVAEEAPAEDLSDVPVRYAAPVPAYRPVAPAPPPNSNGAGPGVPGPLPAKNGSAARGTNGSAVPKPGSNGNGAGNGSGPRPPLTRPGLSAAGAASAAPAAVQGPGRLAAPRQAPPRRERLWPEPQVNLLPGQALGLVLEVSTGLARVAVEGGHGLLCGLRGNLSAEDTGFTNVVSVGDRVIIRPDGGERGVVEAVLPRRSALARPDVYRSHLRQVIVANADQLLVVAAYLEPAFWPELVDRYLIAAALNRLQPLICVNKVDLAPAREEVDALLRPWVALGYPVIFTSATSGLGLAELRNRLAGQVTVLAGLSGVGKSSLLSAVEPGLNLKVHEVSQHWQAGQHTTTQASLHALAGGGYVADTPGIREFGLAGLRRHELAAWYPEIASAAAGCRFNDCTHTAEPGCAVRLAVRHGHIAAVRYDNFRKIRATLPE